MAAIQTLGVPNTMNAPFVLTEGQLVFNGRYQTSLTSTGAERSEADKNIHQGTQPITPSSIGEHSTLDMTILENAHGLELTSTILIGGGIVHLNIESIIADSWELCDTEPCDHPSKTPLQPQYENFVLTTSVACPSAVYGKISIVQVSGNPVAQLLSCDYAGGNDSLLQTNCCLNCAYEQAVNYRFKTIIAT
jgi:hypothetical protein